MAINDDLKNVAELCADAADAATDKLIALGPRPADAAAAATWDAQDAILKNKISTLNNLSATISSLIVTSALQAVWPALIALDKATESAQSSINAIKDISKAMAVLASLINLGVSVVTLATQPSPANAGSVATAFTNMLGTF